MDPRWERVSIVTWRVEVGVVRRSGRSTRDGDEGRRVEPRCEPEGFGGEDGHADGFIGVVGGGSEGTSVVRGSFVHEGRGACGRNEADTGRRSIVLGESGRLEPCRGSVGEDDGGGRRGGRSWWDVGRRTAVLVSFFVRILDRRVAIPDVVVVRLKGAVGGVASEVGGCFRDGAGLGEGDETRGGRSWEDNLVTMDENGRRSELLFPSTPTILSTLF